MSNAKTGLWSALGALVGGVAGAYAGKFAVQERPRYRYATESRFAPPAPGRRGPGGTEIEDAMVIGGSTGAVVGAFIAGTLAGEDTPAAPQLQGK